MGKKERSSTPLFLLCSLISSARTQSPFPDKPVPSGLNPNLHIHLRLRRSRATGARWSVFGVLPETDSNLECAGHWPPRNVPFVLYRKRALLQVILEFVFPRGGGVWELEFRLQDPPLSYAPWNAPLGTKGAAPSTQECRLEAGATKKTRKCALGAAWNAPDFFGARDFVLRRERCSRRGALKSTKGEAPRQELVRKEHEDRCQARIIFGYWWRTITRSSEED